MASQGSEQRRRCAGWATVIGLVVVFAACSRPSSGQSSVELAQPPTSRASAAISSTTVSDSDSGGSSPTFVAPTVKRPAEQVPISIAVGAAVEDQLGELISATTELRGHEFVSDPNVVFVSPEEVVRLRMVGLAADLDFNELAPDEALFQLMGILADDQDLFGFYTEFYSAGTAAFYDLETEELVVPIQGEVLSPYEQWVLVHELTHALMDQTFPEVSDAYRSATNGSSDLPTGLLALIEGEAVLVQTLFFDAMSVEDRQAVVAEAATRGNPAFSAAPRYFQSLLRFPYRDGAEFVIDLFERGGLTALDQAFGQPPSTTEHIYYPDRYVAGHGSTQMSLEVPDLTSYELVDTGVWGELGWRSLLGQFVNGATAASATDGWAGDRYNLLWNSEAHQALFTATIEADSVRDASELAGALESYVDIALGLERRLISPTAEDWEGSDYAAIGRVGSRVTIVLAQNPAAGRAAAVDLRLIDSVSIGIGEG